MREGGEEREKLRQRQTFIFRSATLPVVAHFSWMTGDPSSGELYLFAEREAAETIAASLPREDAEKILSAAPVLLYRTGERVPLHLSGYDATKIALQLEHFQDSNVSRMKSSGAPKKPKILGYWNPPSEGNGSLLCMWCSPDSGFQFSMVRSKIQAIALIRSLTWLKGEERRHYLKSIDQLRLPVHSSVEPLHVHGSIAKVLGVASFIEKARIYNESFLKR